MEALFKSLAVSVLKVKTNYVNTIPHDYIKTLIRLLDSGNLHEENGKLVLCRIFDANYAKNAELKAKYCCRKDILFVDIEVYNDQFVSNLRKSGLALDEINHKKEPTYCPCNYPIECGCEVIVGYDIRVKHSDTHFSICDTDPIFKPLKDSVIKAISKYVNTHASHYIVEIKKFLDSGNLREENGKLFLCRIIDSNYAKNDAIKSKYSGRKDILFVDIEVFIQIISNLKQSGLALDEIMHKKEPTYCPCNDPIYCGCEVIVGYDIRVKR